MSTHSLPIRHVRPGHAGFRRVTEQIRAANPDAYDRAYEDTTRRIDRARMAAREEMRHQRRQRLAGAALAAVLLVGIFGVLVLLAAGCTQPDTAYVAGDVRTYEAVAPDYVGLLEKSGRDPEAIARGKRTVRSWRLRIVAAGVVPTATADPFSGSAAEPVAVSGTAR